METEILLPQHSDHMQECGVQDNPLHGSELEGLVPKGQKGLLRASSPRGIALNWAPPDGFGPLTRNAPTVATTQQP